MDKKTISLINGYLDKARKKLEVAKRLLEGKEYEDAVSRAYYSVYHAVSALLLTEGLQARTHEGIVTLFGLHFVKTGKFDKKFGRFLTNLKDDRENGDYSLFSVIDENIAKESIIEAEQLIAEIRDYLNTNFGL